MQTALTETEQRELVALEGDIQRGQQEFLRVGNALAEIRDKELFRGEYKSFDAYLEIRWGFKRKYAQHIIRAAEMVKSLPAGTATIVATESQARELSKVDASQRVEVLEKAKKIADDEKRPMRARDIANAAPPKSPANKPEPIKVSPPQSGGSEMPAPLKAPAAPSKRAYSPETFNGDASGLVDLVLIEFSEDELKKAAGHLEMLAAKIRHKVRAMALTKPKQLAEEA